MAGTIISTLKRLIGGHRAQRFLQTLDIGEGTRCSPENFDGMFPHLIHIGRHCVLSPTSMVLCHDASYYLFTGQYRVSKVWIGDHVFVGYRSMILPGVRIGSRVVIGAGSVVTHDIPANSLAVGSPARVIGSLEEYLERRERHSMFPAPFSGKAPSEISPDEVRTFQEAVYSAFLRKND